MTDSTPAIFLDMDETLLHYTQEWSVGAIELPEFAGFVMVRPHVVTCLQEISKFADVYVFSAGGLDYVYAALRAARLHYLLDGHFSSRRDNFLPSKDRPWILVDDLPATHDNTLEKLRQLARFDETPPTLTHVHRIPAWHGDRRDDALRHLPRILAARLASPTAPWARPAP